MSGARMELQVQQLENTFTTGTWKKMSVCVSKNVYNPFARGWGFDIVL